MRESLSYGAPDSERDDTAEEESRQEKRNMRFGRELLRRIFKRSSQNEQVATNGNAEIAPTPRDDDEEMANDPTKQPSENQPEPAEESIQRQEQEQEQEQETEGEYWRDQMEEAVNETMPGFDELMRQLEAGEHESTKTTHPWNGKEIPIYDLGNIRFPYLEHSIMYNTNTGGARMLVDHPELFEKTKQQVEYQNRAASSFLSFNYRNPKADGIESQPNQVCYGCLGIVPKTLVDFGYSTIETKVADEKTIKQQVDNTKNKLLRYNNNMPPSHERIIEMLAPSPEIQVLRYDKDGNPTYRPLFIKIPQLRPIETRTSDQWELLYIALAQAAYFDVPIFEFPSEHVPTREEKLKNSPESRLSRVTEEIDDEIDRLTERRGGSEKFNNLLNRLAESSDSAEWTERHKGLYPRLLELVMQREEIARELGEQGTKSNPEPLQKELADEPSLERESVDGIEEAAPGNDNPPQGEKLETSEQNPDEEKLKQINAEIRQEIDSLVDDAEASGANGERIRKKLEALAETTESDGWGAGNRRKYGDLYDLLAQKEAIEEKLGLGPSLDDKIGRAIERLLADERKEGATEDELEALRQKLAQLAVSTKGNGWTRAKKMRYPEIYELAAQKDEQSGEASE